VRCVLRGAAFSRSGSADRRITVAAAVGQEVRKRPEVLRLMTHPGVRPLTALAYVLIIGMIPSEDSSGGKQRLF
jgi:hypothetical protein